MNVLAFFSLFANDWRFQNEYIGDPEYRQLAGQLSWLERGANNAKVAGSIPVLAMEFFGRLPVLIVAVTLDQSCTDSEWNLQYEMAFLEAGCCPKVEGLEHTSFPH